MGGRDEKTHGFGMVMRLGTGFADPIASSENIDFSSFKHINVSLIFNYMFRGANVRGN
ncbi:hypothetical protein AGMMS50268_19810 [Spirochaetia bacterium]|nr:hypothetical protein AGMMS50268_19810 [Spirochaetia bacterium]